MKRECEVEECDREAERVLIDQDDEKHYLCRPHYRPAAWRLEVVKKSARFASKSAGGSDE